MRSFLLPTLIDTFHGQKRMADKAIVQMTDEQIRVALDPETNSVAVIIKHMSGNMVSRWTDFLTTDGEKPDRDRDGEFIDTFVDRPDLLACWEHGWACLFDALARLTDDDINRIVITRGEPSSVLSAILRQVSHYGYHVGQITLIARILVGDRWQVITIPRGQSKAFNARMMPQA